MGQARDFQNRGACAPLVYSLSKGLFYGEGLFSFGRVVEGTSSANTNCELFSYWREVRSKFAVGHEDNLAFVAATPRPWRETTRRCRGSVAGAFPKEGQRTERGGARARKRPGKPQRPFFAKKTAFCSATVPVSAGQARRKTPTQRKAVLCQRKGPDNEANF